MPTASVALSPLLYSSCEDSEAIVVVIDVLRATSTISTAFETGVAAIFPVETVKEALEHKANGRLVAGERDGEKIVGFDLGNSPHDFMDAGLRAKEIALTTTNGTRAFKMAAMRSHAVVSGSFLNLSALCTWLIEQQRNVVLLCAGWKGEYCLEDSLFAGAIIEQLKTSKSFTSFCDAALASGLLYKTAEHNLFEHIQQSAHGQRLKRLNLEEDSKYCLTIDQSDIIPILKGDRIVRWI